jgi:hypothetical protein
MEGPVLVYADSHAFHEHAIRMTIPVLQNTV